MKIVVPGLEGVVVVFPTTLDNAVVTVSDVIVAVHRAVQQSAFEHHREFTESLARNVLSRENKPSSIGSS